MNTIHFNGFFRGTSLKSIQAIMWLKFYKMYQKKSYKTMYGLWNILQIYDYSWGFKREALNNWLQILENKNKIVGHWSEWFHWYWSMHHFYCFVSLVSFWHFCGLWVWAKLVAMNFLHNSKQYLGFGTKLPLLLELG